HDVFGENDPARRRAAIDEIYTEDCVFHEPRGVYRGRDAIDRVAGAIKATHPDFRYQPIAEPEEVGDGGGSNGSRAPRVRRQPTPGLTSSLPGTAGLPPFISFSTRYAERLRQQHHESLGTTSPTRRSICSSSSKTGFSRISSAPVSATSR